MKKRKYLNMHTNINNVEKKLPQVVHDKTAWIAQIILNCLHFQHYEDVFQYLRTATLLNLDRMFLEACPSFYCSY